VVLISFGGNFYTTTQTDTIGFTGMKMMIYRHSAKIAFISFPPGCAGPKPTRNIFLGMIIFTSYRRRPVPRIFKQFWTPAFAGVTEPCYLDVKHKREAEDKP
jgi:hypothetical protein